MLNKLLSVSIRLRAELVFATMQQLQSFQWSVLFNRCKWHHWLFTLTDCYK